MWFHWQLLYERQDKDCAPLLLIQGVYVIMCIVAEHAHPPFSWLSFVDDYCVEVGHSHKLLVWELLRYSVHAYQGLMTTV